MANFAIIGVAGYIAPRHLEAIKEGGHQLVAALDPRDSVGILDRYFADVPFFTDQKQFSDYLGQFRRGGTQKIDYVAIASPNYLHAEHIEIALRNGANAICEKPLVLSTKELDRLAALERETDRRVFTVLQLRVHDAISALKKKVASSPGRHKVKLTYMTTRGPWYLASWKGDEAKSGGLAFNIGIHFFDMLTWIFGSAEEATRTQKSNVLESGTLKLAKADVDWLLTIDRKMLPPECVKAGKTTFRSIQIDGAEFEFSEGFTELHKIVYRQILEGNGHGLEDARPAIELVERLRGS